MPTSSFRSSTTTRTTTSLGNSTSSSSSIHRRSRSVTRFEEPPPSLNRRGKFVNTVRGSGMPDISLDDLAIQLFSSSDFGGVSSSLNEKDSNRRRSRSLSRRGSSIAELRNSSGGCSNNCSGNGVSDGASRRRRSLSVASRRISNSENEYFQRNQKHTRQRDGKEKPSSQQRGLRRCSSYKDLSRSHDGYTSEKRKQELRAEIMSVEEHGKELKKIVGESHPNSKETAATRRLITRGRKRSKDINRTSKHLIDDADKIIQDFISSFEETDISSFDGEPSDTSSIIGGTMKPMMQYGNVESFKMLPPEMDGVVLPWLKWETSNDITPLLCSDSYQCHSSSESGRQDAKEELAATADQEQSVNTKSSRGSWSPGVANSFTLDREDTSKTGDVNSCKNRLLSQLPRRSRIDIDDYLKPLSDENFLFERWKYRERMNSGGLVICHCGSLK